MPIPKEVKDELPEEVVEEVEQLEGGAAEPAKEEPQTETIRLSRRQKKQQETDERIHAAEEAARAREAEAASYRQQLEQTRQETARLAAIVEQRLSQPTPKDDDKEDGGDIDAKIAKHRKRAVEALTKSQDFEEYQSRQDKIMALMAEKQARAIIAAQPKPQQQAPQQQKPDWVRAIEFQYPEVLTHAQGQSIVGLEDAALGAMGQAFGPERLHAAFQGARARLGLSQQRQAAPSSGQRQLLTGVTGGGMGRPAAKQGERTVNIPKESLAIMMRSGMSKADAAKAWAESYPDEVG